MHFAGNSYNAVVRAVGVLIDKKILQQTENAGKTRIYTYAGYLDVLRWDT